MGVAEPPVHSIERNGVRIAYRAAGTGPVVLLTHGYGASSHMFESNMAALADIRTMIAWDLRGHGASDYPSNPAEYTREASIADMLAILDDAGAERAVLGGHSLGGYLSLLFALEHPERTDGLVLIGTGPGFRKADAREKWNRMSERYAEGLEKRGLAGLPGSTELTADVHRDESGLIHAARGILSQHDSRVIDSLADIDVPVLVVVGEDDEVFIPGSLYMTEKLPDAELVVIPGAGHAPNMTHASEFDAAARSFLINRT
jgi:pimeloyl-ACP methyl ester carboxylesterase